MPATIQITQGEIVGDAGRSVLGLKKESNIVLLDAGGPGADSYLWEIISWPSPLPVPPSLGTPNAYATAVAAPQMDGIYIVRLTRVDGGVTTTDTKFFGCKDEDGLHLPSAGMNRQMANTSATSQTWGWAGGTDGSSNVLLDAFLRTRRLREGRYVGGWANYTNNDPNVDRYTLTWGVSKTNQLVFQPANAGEFDINLLSAGAEEGAHFHVFVNVGQNSGQVTISMDGNNMYALPYTYAPQNLLYEFDLWFAAPFGWISLPPKLVEPAYVLQQSLHRELVIFAGNHSVTGTTWTDIGAFEAGMQFLDSGNVTFDTIISNSSPDSHAELRLFRTDSPLPVASSVISATTTVPMHWGVVLTVGNGDDQFSYAPLSVYRIQLRSTGVQDTATCSRASITYTWAG